MDTKQGLQASSRLERWRASQHLDAFLALGGFPMPVSLSILNQPSSRDTNCTSYLDLDNWSVWRKVVTKRLHNNWDHQDFQDLLQKRKQPGKSNVRTRGNVELNFQPQLPVPVSTHVYKCIQPLPAQTQSGTATTIMHGSPSSSF